MHVNFKRISELLFCLTSLNFFSCIFDSKKPIQEKTPDEIFVLSQIHVNWKESDSLTPNDSPNDSIRIYTKLIDYHQVAVDQHIRKNAKFIRFGDSIVMETIRNEILDIDSTGGYRDTIYHGYPISMVGRIYQGIGKKILAIGNAPDCLIIPRNSTSICLEYREKFIVSNSCILLEPKSSIEEALFGSASYFHSQACSEVTGIEKYSWFEIQYVYKTDRVSD